jgi:hypothetical protein
MRNSRLPINTLYYDRGSAPWRKKTLRILFALGLVLIFVLAIRWGPAFARQISMLYWQHQCSIYDGTGPYVVEMPNRTPENVAPITSIPPSLAVPVSLHNLFPYIDTAMWWPKNFQEPIIYLHGRRSRGPGGGEERLVIVEGDPSAGLLPRITDASLLPFAQVTVIQEGTLFRSPKLLPRQIPFPGSSKTVVGLFAAQSDLSDDSHFTFDYSYNGQRDTVDGWLEANDSVTLRCRHPIMIPTLATSPFR